MVGRIFRKNGKDDKRRPQENSIQEHDDVVELPTVLCRIEGVINARPLTPLTEDISDVRALTPDDFLRDTSLDSARAVTMQPEVEASAGGSLGSRWR